MLTEYLSRRNCCHACVSVKCSLYSGCVQGVHVSIIIVRLFFKFNSEKILESCRKPVYQLGHSGTPWLNVPPRLLKWIFLFLTALVWMHKNSQRIIPSSVVVVVRVTEMLNPSLCLCLHCSDVPRRQFCYVPRGWGEMWRKIKWWNKKNLY